MAKTTKADFKYFKERCFYWQKKFQLSNWKLFVDYGNAAKNARASYYCQGEGRLVTINLADEWVDKPDKWNLDQCAFHELSEVLLHELRHLAQVACSDAEVNERTHMIIRVFENVVFPVLRK
jgi:hypothetical protein